MALEIIEVKANKDLKKFVKFQFNLYKDNPAWVPPLITDELHNLMPSINPAFENSEAKFCILFYYQKLVFYMIE